jgi:hypothetical protein
LRREHGLFCVVLLVAALARLIVALGYPPAFWFFDSLPYLRAMLPLTPYRVRPIGYSYFLALLEPLHSLRLVTSVQAVMGLAMGTAVYAVLRRYQVPGWGATLAAAPVLLSAYELQMEHFVLSDTLFGLLVTLAVVLTMWWPVPPAWMCALAGLILAWATLDREQGTALPVPFVLYLGTLLTRGIPVRRALAGIAAMCLALAAPLLAYAWWFAQVNGSFQLTSSSGAFLYSRVSAFARCSVIKPPADERWLCISTPPAKRPDATFYAWSARSPINIRPPGGSTLENFALALAGSAAWSSQRQYMFPATTPQSLRALARANRELPYYRDAYVYNGGGNPSTRIVEPFAGWMRTYQRFVVLPGTLLGLIVLAGLAGLTARWRRFGGPALLPWLTGVALIVTPAATTDYGARYLIASIPVFCIAAAIGVKDVSEWVTAPAV